MERDLCETPPWKRSSSPLGLMATILGSIARVTCFAGFSPEVIWVCWAPGALNGLMAFRKGLLGTVQDSPGARSLLGLMEWRKARAIPALRG